MNSTWLIRTGQHRILIVGLLTQICGLLFVSTVPNVAMDSRLYLVLLMAGLAISVAGFFGLCLAIRCPKCHSHLFWKAISRSSVFGGLWGLLTSKVCPECDQ